MDDPLPGNLILTALLTSGQVYLLIFSIIGVSLLFLGSALVSGSEVAYFSLTHDQLLEAEQTKGNARKKIAALLKHPKQLLATILILNNFINISIVMLSTYVTAAILGDVLSGGAIIVALTIVITFLMVFL
ncbi:DUF21 domain-containing protein, partial [Reichenbachiella sp.]